MATLSGVVSGLSYLPRSPTKKSTKRLSKPTSPMIGMTPSILSLDFRSHTAATHTLEKVWAVWQPFACGRFCFSSFCVAPFPSYHYACISIRTINAPLLRWRGRSLAVELLRQARSRPSWAVLGYVALFIVITHSLEPRELQPMESSFHKSFPLTTTCTASRTHTVKNTTWYLVPGIIINNNDNA